MSDLVLRTRLSMLRKNLDDVRQTPLSIAAIESDVRELLDFPVKSSPLTASLVKLLSYAYAANLASLAGEHVVVAKNIDLIVAELRQTVGQLEDVENGAVQSIHRRSIAMRESGLGSRLQDLLATCADDKITDLDTIGPPLEEARRLDSSANGDAEDDTNRALAIRRQAWDAYRARSHESSEVFSEYVDLLGGLALRDAGFDRGICRLADKLFRDAGRFADLNWSLTIPAREEAVKVTLARVIRVGFPEWTIWALPLAAGEFGYLVVTRLEALERYVDAEAADEDSKHQLRVCLADAFATLIMGPAYACAAVLLRLDPATAFSPEDDSLTARRAEVILRTLAQMGAATGNYVKLRQRLEHEWTEALDQTGAVGSLDGAVYAQLDDWIAHVAKSIGPGRTLPGGAWERITNLAGDLADERSDETQPIFGDDDVRYVLNAAWLCRLQTDEPDEPDATRIDRIAADAIGLWQRIEEKQDMSKHEPPGQAPSGFEQGAKK